MAQIIGIGANVMDTLLQLEQYPEEDTKQQARSITQCGGGPCGTGLVAAAKLGADCAYVGNCSDDAAGKFLRADFEKYGVRTEHMHTVCGTAGFQATIWLANQNSSRTCVFHKGTVPPTQLDEEAVKVIQNARVLLVDGNDMPAALAAAEVARKAGVTVLYDAGRVMPDTEKLLPLTDVLIPSEAFALSYTDMPTATRAAKALWEQYRPKVVVVTCGKDGCVMYDGQSACQYPAFTVDAVDTNGAGDVFHGAFAYALTQNWDYERCCLFASAVSALKCTKIGARTAIPTLDAVNAFLRERT